MVSNVEISLKKSDDVVKVGQIRVRGFPTKRKPNWSLVTNSKMIVESQKSPINPKNLIIIKIGLTIIFTCQILLV